MKWGGGKEQTSLTYTTNSQLATKENDSGEIACYQYDPFGRRISKTVNGETTYYIYSSDGLLAELDQNGKMRVAYGWKPDSDWGTSPLWQANLSEGQTLKNASYHYLISDHLGTPQLAINSAGEQSWKINSDAFGNSELDANNQITMNLRFPGQYYDAETRLSYNYFRDYDAKTGRYIQSDPIGLAGGINTYGYVGGNPLVYSDPTGEFAQVMVPVAVAAAFVVAACIVSPVCNKSLPNVQFPNIGSGIFGGVDELPYLNSRHKGEDNLLDRCENNKGLGHNPFDPKDRC